jgi:hypothetical protein
MSSPPEMPAVRTKEIPMNASITAADSDGTTTQRTSTKVRHVRRALAMLLLAITATMGVTTATTQSAAALSNPTATVCIKASYSMYGRTYYGAYGSYPVRVDAWIGGAQQQLTLNTAPNGCVTVTLLAGYSWRFRVYSYLGSRWYVGSTGWQYMQNGYHYNFGTLYV